MVPIKQNLFILTAVLWVATACTQSPEKPLSFEAFQKHERALTRPLATDPTPTCDQTCQARRQEFRYVVYVGKQVYCYWDLKKAETQLDFDALASELENSITTYTSATQYYLVLRQWASAFHDGHVNAMLGKDMTDIEIYTAPVRLEVLAPGTDHEQVVVTESSSEVPVGSEVLAINGVSIGQALDEAEKSTSGSTKRMRRYFGARRLVDTTGIENGSLPLNLTIPQLGRDPVTVSLPRTASLSLSPSIGGATPVDTGASYFKAAILPGALGYLKIDAFMGSEDELLLGQAMDRLAQTQGLLIDLRANGGGDLSGNVVISRLIQNTVSRYDVSERMADFTISMRPDMFLLPWTQGEAFADWHSRAVDPSKFYGLKPVVALVGAHCFSACDTFVAGLKANGLATIVGEATGGGTGTPLVFDLPVSANQFRYSVIRGKTAKGDLIEGVGTSPDVLLEPTTIERSTRKDDQLLKALAILSGQVNPTNQTNTANSSVAALTSAIATISRSWAQDLNTSPTMSDELELKRIQSRDEL